MAGLPFMNASLTLADRAIGGGGGFAESFYQPFLLGWESKRFNLNTGYLFFLDTGKAGAGYGGNALTLGDTFYLTKNKAIVFSSYQFSPVSYDESPSPRLRRDRRSVSTTRL